MRLVISELAGLESFPNLGALPASRRRVDGNASRSRRWAACSRATGPRLGERIHQRRNATPDCVTRYSVVVTDRRHSIPRAGWQSACDEPRDARLVEGDDGDGGAEIRRGELGWGKDAELQAICAQPILHYRGHPSVRAGTATDCPQPEVSFPRKLGEIGHGNDALDGAVLAHEHHRLRVVRGARRWRLGHSRPGGQGQEDGGKER